METWLKVLLQACDEHTEAEEASYENYKNVEMPKPETQETPF